MTIAALLLSPLLASGPGAGTPASDEQWLALDRELETLASALSGEAGPVRYGGLVRAFYGYSENQFDAVGTGELSGFTLNDVDVFTEASFGDFSVRASFDAGGGEAELEDGYAVLPWGDASRLRIGRFKPHVLRSASIDPENLLFKERTFLGSAFDRWDLGAEFFGEYDDFSYWFSATNGASGQGADHFYAARLEWLFYDPGLPLAEGARDRQDLLRMVAGATIFAESFTPGTHDNDGWGLDGALALGPWAFHVEWLSLDTGFEGTQGEGRERPIVFAGNSSPIALTFSCRFDEHWQGALRMDRADNDDDTEKRALALQYLPDERAVTWIFEAVDLQSDGEDGLVLHAGIAIGASR